MEKWTPWLEMIRNGWRRVERSAINYIFTFCRAPQHSMGSIHSRQFLASIFHGDESVGEFEFEHQAWKRSWLEDWRCASEMRWFPFFLQIISSRLKRQSLQSSSSAFLVNFWSITEEKIGKLIDFPWSELIIITVWIRPINLIVLLTYWILLIYL